MKTSKTDRKRYFENIGNKVSNNTSEKCKKFENKLSQKQKKIIVFSMFGFIALFLVIVTIKTLGTTHSNPFNDVNKRAKQLTEKDSSSYVPGSSQDASMSDILDLMQIKAEIESISPDNMTSKDSAKILEINRKLDKMMKK